jgi:hypothetical protein
MGEPTIDVNGPTPAQGTSTHPTEPPPEIRRVDTLPERMLEKRRDQAAPERPMTAPHSRSTLSGAASEKIRALDSAKVDSGKPHLSRNLVRVASAALALGVGLWIYYGVRRPGDLGAAGHSKRDRPAAATPAVLPIASDLPESAAPTAPPPPTVKPSAAGARGGLVRIRLSVTPADARVQLAGVPIASGPIELPRSSKPQELVVSADGYATRTMNLVPSEDREIRIELRARGDHHPDHASASDSKTGGDHSSAKKTHKKSTLIGGSDL